MYKNTNCFHLAVPCGDLETAKKEIVQVNPKAKYMPFFKEARILCYTHDGNKFWEMSTLRPDWLLEDLAQIAAGKTTKNLHFYKEVK